jgi:hypothetical protein
MTNSEQVSNHLKSSMIDAGTFSIRMMFAENPDLFRNPLSCFLAFSGLYKDSDDTTRAHSRDDTTRAFSRDDTRALSRDTRAPGRDAGG